MNLINKRNEENKKNRKTTKELIDSFITILSKILTFVFCAILIIFIILVFISSLVKASPDKFQEALKYINSHKSVISVKKDNDKNIIEVDSFKLEPEKIFIDPKTKKSWYTDNPTQSSHYDKNNVHEMKKEAMAETTKDEGSKDTNGNPIPSPGKTVISSFQSRPIYKITKDDGYIAKGSELIKNAKDIVTGASGSNMKCRDANEGKVACEYTYEQKTCNEEVRTIKRVCEKFAKPSVLTINHTYPNCRRFAIAQGVYTPCPPGYSQILYADMIRSHPPHSDDVYFCMQPVGNKEQAECYSDAYYIASWAESNHDAGRATVPKKLHSRIRTSNAYSGSIAVTVINETTGQPVVQNARYSTGGIIELPYSETIDQTFRFYIMESECRGWFCSSPIGILVLYVDHINREKTIKVEWIEDKEACHDI